jgi:serine/threonine-protein kinase
MKTQTCPNCGLAHDVSVYVSGQRVTCRCGIRFEVRRTDVSQVPTRLGGPVVAANTVVPAGDAPSPLSGVVPPSAPVAAEIAGAATVLRDSTSVPMPVVPLTLEQGHGNTLLGATRPELPGFELQELLGRGGMGEVWRARQQSLGRMVAVKLLPPRLAKDPEFVTRFEKEATALAALNHPNIIQIIDRGVAGEHYYFAMEFVEGRSLREAMGPGGLTPAQALRTMLQVARAIECAHQKGIVHRDLKPENILLDERGHVKVADFGLAGIRGPDSKLQLTATAVAMGTLNYMAPEQRRDAKNVDGRADLFSLGVVLYEVLTGELPLGRFRMPSQRVAGVDPRVDAVVARLLENEPEARYASASEVCAALETMVAHSSAPGLAGAGEGGEARPLARGAARSTAVRKLRSSWRNMRTGLAVVGGLFLVGILARELIGPVDLHVGGDKVVIGTSGVSVKAGTKPWPTNTNKELFVASSFTEPSAPGGLARFEQTFDAGKEEMNAWSGTWRLVDGELRVEQGGNDTGGRLKLVPRAYVARRYFSSDDFTAEVLMDVKPLGPEYPSQPADAQHYGELAFRIKDLQVSAFAIPGVGMRLSWRYFKAEGEELVGNSAQDQEDLVQDEVPVPATGPFLVKLQMKKRKGGVEVEATLNGVRFARKLLPGLEGKVGKVALGCRNLACTFDDLKVRAIPMPRPKRNVANQQE